MVAARRFATALLVTLCVLSTKTAASAIRCPDLLASGIPTRSPNAPDGSEFARRIGALDAASREAAIASQLQAGNVPSPVRRLVPVDLQRRPADRRAARITLCVAQDYLSIGSDGDFLRVPMGLATAIAAAAGFGFALPTRRMVDAIYEQAELRLAPQPLPPGEAMRSTAYYVHHNERIVAQHSALQSPTDLLVAGHKKDLVITNRLWANLGRVAIYGWHRPDGTPIQPLSTVHGARYADYSHGVRLVSLVAYVEGEARSLLDLLGDPEFAAALSDEGPIERVAELAQAVSGAAAKAAALAYEAKRLVEAAGRPQAAMRW